MTIGEARRTANAAAIAAEDGMTPLPGAVTRDALATLAAEVARLRSLPVIPTCGDCCNSGIDDRTEGEVCKHDLASDDVDFYPAVAMAAPPPSWCPLRGKAGGR